MTITTNAQIPNSGFENWTTVGNYQDPTFWGSTNTYSTGPFYAVTKSTDHYPVTVGDYSVRIENNTALSPNYSGRGYLSTGHPPPGPNFPTTGHPTSLTGYYKFAPLNADTMLIQIQLYKNGAPVSYGEFSTPDTTSSWTSFNIPLSNYLEADYGSIFIAAYYATDFNSLPRGNSVLYVDNLNFDNLINSISEQTSESTAFSLYPNPASDIVKLNINEVDNEELSLTIYNIAGTLVKSETLKQNQQEINIGNLNNGIYLVTIKTKNLTENQRLIIQR